MFVLVRKQPNKVDTYYHAWGMAGGPSFGSLPLACHFQRRGAAEMLLSDCATRAPAWPGVEYAIEEVANRPSIFAPKEKLDGT